MWGRLRAAAYKVLCPEPVYQYNGVVLHRCKMDGQLITMKAPRWVVDRHVGHNLENPVCLSLKERLLLKLRIIL